MTFLLSSLIPKRKTPHSSPSSPPSSPPSSATSGNNIVIRRQHSLSLFLLAPEIILKIFNYLGLVDVCVLSCVCKPLHHWGHDRTLWRTLQVLPRYSKKNVYAMIRALKKSGRLQSVRRIEFSNNLLSSNVIAHVLQYTPKLEEFHSYNMKITEKACRALVACPFLQVVSLNGGCASNRCLELLSKGANIKSITLSKVYNVTAVGYWHIFPFSNFVSLSMHGLDGRAIVTFAPYSGKFTQLDLSDSSAGDDHMRVLLSQCKNVKNLSLSSSQNITDLTVEHIVEFCPKLEELNVSRCFKISNLGVNMLFQSLSYLTLLNLNYLSVVSPILLPSKSPPAHSPLQVLQLCYTNVTDYDTQKIRTHFPRLQKLGLVGTPHTQ